MQKQYQCKRKREKKKKKNKEKKESYRHIKTNQIPLIFTSNHTPFILQCLQKSLPLIVMGNFLKTLLFQGTQIQCIGGFFIFNKKPFWLFRDNIKYNFPSVPDETANIYDS